MYSAKAHFFERIETRLAQPYSMGLTDLAANVDFAFVFSVVHELPDNGVLGILGNYR